MKFDQLPNKKEIIGENKEKKLKKIEKKATSEKVNFNKNLLKNTEKKFKRQMLGNIPGLEAEDIFFFNKKIQGFLENINFKQPSKIISELFKIEDDFDWIKDALNRESEKIKEEQSKNLELKEYLKETIQKIIDSFCIVLDTKKLGYLLEIITQKYINELLKICNNSKIEISKNTLDFNPGGNMDNIELSLMLANIPSVRDIRLKREIFNYKKDTFRIKAGKVEKQNQTEGWTPIEEINEYTHINPDLVTSKNIINLMAFDGFLSNNFKLPVSDISFKEKIYLYNFLLTNNLYELHKFTFVYGRQKNDLNFFRTFLSIEQGGKEMGNKIIELGEKLPETVANKIFAKFGEIIDSVDEVIEIINKRFEKEIKDTSIIDLIRKNLLKKGSDLLLESHQLILKSNSKKEISEIGREILERLENNKHNSVLLGTAFKSALQENIKLNEIRDVTLESTNDKEKLSEYEKEMLIIFKDNRVNYPKKLLDETTQEFIKVLKNPENKEFFILKDNDDILGFMRFDKLENGNLYAGSLNTRNEIHGLAIGGALLKELLSRKSKENNIEAVVYEKNPMLKKYITEYGFKITGEIENYENTGEKFYKIEIPKGSLENQEPTSNTSALSHAA